MPRTTRTNSVEVETMGSLTKGELRRFLDACDHAGIDDSAEVQAHPDHQGVGTLLMARAYFDTGAPPGYGYPSADPATERLSVPLQPGDRAGYVVGGRFVLGTVEEVTGDLVRWTSDAPEGLPPITATGPQADFTRVNGSLPTTAPRPSTGRLQP